VIELPEPDPKHAGHAPHRLFYALIDKQEAAAALW
jgi:hypothetical protein